MEFWRNILRYCTAAAECMIVLYAYAIIGLLWDKFVKKNPAIHGKDFLLLPHKPFGWVVFVVTVIGIINLVLSVLLASTEIGNFYEKDEFSADYEATLYVRDTPIFCIVEVRKWTDDGEKSYYIEKVKLPYGHEDEQVDAEYDAEKNRAVVSLGHRETDYDLELKGLATQASYKMLADMVVTNYGEFCGSKEAGVFHRLDCHHVSSIKPQNLVYFDNADQADALGYSACDTCFSW